MDSDVGVYEYMCAYTSICIYSSNNYRRGHKYKRKYQNSGGKGEGKGGVEMM